MPENVDVGAGWTGYNPKPADLIIYSSSVGMLIAMYILLPMMMWDLLGPVYILSILGTMTVISVFQVLFFRAHFRRMSLPRWKVFHLSYPEVLARIERGLEGKGVRTRRSQPEEFYGYHEDKGSIRFVKGFDRNRMVFHIINEHVLAVVEDDSNIIISPADQEKKTASQVWVISDKGDPNQRLEWSMRTIDDAMEG